MTATIQKPTSQQTSQVSAVIVEGLASSPARQIDLENGVIRNVKLIGFESKNGRSYPASVLKAAVHLYEGAKVNINHPSNGDPTTPRQYQDRLGVIRSVRFVEGSGNFGDFHFNPKHPAAEQVCWDAKNNPEALGFSHNALLKLGASKNGKQVIEQIINVRSMDLVADPATTASLFESETMDPEIIPAPTPTSSSDPASQVKNAFKQMIIAAIDDESLDLKATMKKIGEIMKAQAKLMGVTPAPESGDDEAAESVQLKQQLGLLQNQLEQYQAKEKQARLLESINKQLATAGLDPKNSTHVSEMFSKTLLATESENDRTALIADRAGLLKIAGNRQPTGQPTYTPATANATESIDWAQRLTSS